MISPHSLPQSKRQGENTLHQADFQLSALAFMQAIRPIKPPKSRITFLANVRQWLKTPFLNCVLPSVDSNKPTVNGTKTKVRTLLAHNLNTRQLHKIDVVLSLLNAHGFFEKKNQENATVKTRAYIKHYGSEGDNLLPILQSTLRSLALFKGPIHYIARDAEHPKRASRSTCRHMAIHIAKMTTSFQLTHDQATRILSHSRFDKHNTGLNNTIIITPEDALIYSLHSSFDPTCQKTPQLLLNLLQFFNETHQPDKVDRSNNASGQTLVSFPLGYGSFGVVKTAIDIAADKIKAVKKFDQAHCSFSDADLLRGSAAHEYRSKSLLKSRLTPQELESFLVPEAFVESEGSQGQTKAYLFSELITSGNGDEELNRIYTSMDSEEVANAKMQSLMTSWIFDVTLLEKNNFCHPDLKPSNIIGGKIGDLADLIEYDGKRSLQKLYDGCLTHTGRFTPPEYFSVDTKEPLSSAGRRQLFKAYNRFSLGLMLVELAIGNPVATAPHRYNSSIFTLPVSIAMRANGTSGVLKLKHGFKDIQCKINQLKSADLSPTQKAGATIGMLLASAKSTERISPSEAKLYLPKLIEAFENREPLIMSFKSTPKVYII